MFFMLLLMNQLGKRLAVRRRRLLKAARDSRKEGAKLFSWRYNLSLLNAGMYFHFGQACMFLHTTYPVAVIMLRFPHLHIYEK